MKEQSAYYEESSKVNLLGLPVAYFLVFVMTVGLGFLYTFIMKFIPIVYLNVLLTIGFGMAIGFLVKFLTRLTHNRSRRSRLILAVVAGLLANYFQWVAFLIYTLIEEPTFFIYLTNLRWLLTSPSGFFEMIQLINGAGLWEVFGIPFKGFTLTIVWILEFLIISVLAFRIVYGTPTYPYSERLHKWYPKFTLSEDFKMQSAANSTIEGLQNDTVETIKNFGLGTGAMFSKVHLFYLPEEREQYLSVERVYIEDENKTNKEIVINNLTISSDVAKQIRTEFENKRERIEII